MRERGFIKKVVLKTFGCSDYFFESAWKAIDSSYGKSAGLAEWRGNLDALYDSAQTDRQYDALKTISILYEAVKEIKKTGRAEEFLVVLEETSRKHRAEEELKLKILRNVESLVKDVKGIIDNKSLKPAILTTRFTRGKEGEHDYELITSGKKRKFITARKAEERRENKGTGIKNEIFIDDERKDVFFNRCFAEGFNGQNYAMLIHFVTREGAGGNTETIYNNVWGESSPSGDDLNNAVEGAVTRFRRLLKKYKIGEVPSLKKNMYDISKAYVMRPKPRYCILKRIKKEKEEE